MRQMNRVRVRGVKDLLPSGRAAASGFILPLCSIRFDVDDEQRLPAECVRLQVVRFMLLAQLSRHRGGPVPPCPPPCLVFRRVGLTRCARAGRSAPCARCSGTGRRALRLRQLPLLHRALGPSQCPTLAVRTTATAFHSLGLGLTLTHMYE